MPIRKLIHTYLFIASFLLLASQEIVSQSLVINEFLASNKNVNSDEDGDSSDWVEVKNTGSTTIDLIGLSITDDASFPGKWTLPTRILQPDAYLLIWASGKARTGSHLHTNFKLGASGEYVGLYTANGQIIDGIEFGPQIPDISMARFPDGSGDFEPTAKPTPGAKNKQDVPALSAVQFLPASGFYNGSVAVELTSSVAGAVVRYTTNGSDVGSSSKKYTDLLQISKTTVIRARAYKNGSPVSDDISQVYLLDFGGTLPVLSYATDEDNLYGSNGIFDNVTESGSRWERPVSINLVERDGSGFQINAGVRVHGGRSRRHEFPKISTRLYFRSNYGESKLRYRLFDTKSIDQFDRLVIHSGGSSDQFFKKVGKVSRYWSLIRDPLNHNLWQEQGGAVSAARPVVLIINGDIWGVYHIRERVDGDYLQSNYGIANADILRPDNEQIDVDEGDLAAWNSMFYFFENKDLSNSQNYDRAKGFVNIENIIDFFIFNVFAGNWDMPHTNIYMFRERVAKAKWHWVMWDTDVSLGSLGAALPTSINTLSWVIRAEVMPNFAGTGDEEDLLWSTLILRKLLENDSFTRQFVNRFADLMNTTLHPDHIKSSVDAMADVLEDNIHFETEAWPDALRADWENGIGTIRGWVTNRPANQRNHLREKFSLGSDRTVTVKTDGNGQIVLNSLTINDFPWTGLYYNAMPISLTAVSNPGHEFSHWSGASNSSSAGIELNLSSDKTVTAHFDVKQISQPVIRYFSPDSGAVGILVNIFGSNLGGTTSVLFNGTAASFSAVSDTLVTAIVPDSAASGKITIITNGGSIESQTDFVVIVPAPAPAIFSFAPDSGEVGTEVLIRGRSFFEVNSVLFDSVDAAFTVEADTVILAVVPDSAVSGKISISAKGGVTVSAEIFTVIDSSITSVGGGNPGSAVPQSLVLHPAFPNPFNAEVTIAYALPAAAQVKLIVYNMLGQRVRTLVDGHQSAGNKTAHWNGSSASGSEVSSGLYLLVLQADARVLVRKVVLQK